MHRLSEIVNYDLLSNTFYKINKQTGQQQTTYKNGDALKKFRPNVTGHDYLIRKTIDTDHPRPYQPAHHYPTNPENTLNDSFHFKTIDVRTRKSTKHTETSIFSSAPPSPRHPALPDLRATPSLRMSFDDSPASPCNQKSKEKLGKEILNQTLTDYSKLLKQHPTQHKSPKKDIPGCQTPTDPLATLCTTLNHFRKREPEWETNGAVSERTVCQRTGLSEQYSPKHKQKKERLLFLEFHPQCKPKESQQAVLVQNQRKRNLRILEELFIRQNDKNTRRPYQSLRRQ